MSTETVRLIKDREKGEGVMEVGGEGDYIPVSYTHLTLPTMAVV